MADVMTTGATRSAMNAIDQRLDGRPPFGQATSARGREVSTLTPGPMVDDSTILRT
jgi:hypothetical protein